MQEYFEKINELRQEGTSQESALGMLYAAFVQQHPIDSAAMQQAFRELDKHLAPLTKDAQNAVFSIVCELYAENEQLAFQKGVQMGVKLSRELV